MRWYWCKWETTPAFGHPSMGGELCKEFFAVKNAHWDIPSCGGVPCRGGVVNNPCRLKGAWVLLLSCAGTEINRSRPFDFAQGGLLASAAIAIVTSVPLGRMHAKATNQIMDDVQFADNLLQLLNRGRFTTTYKYAVLLGLMDLCLESVTKSYSAPDFVTTRQLAERVAALYWSHTQPYERSILRQNNSGDAGILKCIIEIRGSEALTFFKAKHGRASEFKRALDSIEDILIRMPLPKLQRFDGKNHEILYRISWDDSIRAGVISEHQKTGTAFDNRIHFVPGAAARLIRLNTLLRPLIYREWASKVAAINNLEQSKLESFLFGIERDVPESLRKPLLELHDKTCFYCRKPIKSEMHIDHFIPFARFPDNRIQNLVPAHAACNVAKKDFLAGTSHVSHWVEYLDKKAKELVAIAEMAAVDQHPVHTIAAARGIYMRLDKTADLWAEADKFEAANPDIIRQLLSA